MSRGRRRTDDRRLAHQQSRQVVQVGRLFDDLPAALLGPAPPGRTRRRIEPARDHELGRRPVEPLADLGQDVEGAEVVADGDDEPGALDRGRQPGRAGRIAGRERLLGQERDPGLDQPLADRHRPIRRHRHVDDIRLRLGQHRVDVVVARPAPAGRHGIPGLGRPRDDADQLGPAEPLERLEVLAADPATADEAEPDGSHVSPRCRRCWPAGTARSPRAGRSGSPPAACPGASA